MNFTASIIVALLCGMPIEAHNVRVGHEDAKLDLSAGNWATEFAGAFGSSCKSWEQCQSRKCSIQGICSECMNSEDCPSCAGGYRVCLQEGLLSGHKCYCERPRDPNRDNRAHVSEQRSQPKSLKAVGASCDDFEECESKICVNNICSQCASDTDCPEYDLGCGFINEVGVGPKVCFAPSDVGEYCYSDEDCYEDLFCTGQVCNQCESSMDCDEDQVCFPDSEKSNALVCG